MYLNKNRVNIIYIRVYVTDLGKKIKSLSREFITTETNICPLCKSCIHQGSISVQLTPADKWQTSIKHTDKCTTHTCDPWSTFHTCKRDGKYPVHHLGQKDNQFWNWKMFPVGSYPDGASSYGFTPKGFSQLYLKI